MRLPSFDTSPAPRSYLRRLVREIQVRELVTEHILRSADRYRELAPIEYPQGARDIRVFTKDGGDLKSTQRRAKALAEYERRVDFRPGF